MKTYLLLILLSFSFFSFSQKIVIEIFERQEMVSFRSTTLDSVLMSPDILRDPDPTKTTYVIDLNDETSSYYVNDEFLSVLPIQTIRTNDGLLIVKILEEGFDYGLIIHMGQKQDNVLWYWNSVGMTTVKKTNKFNIIKSS